MEEEIQETVLLKRLLVELLLVKQQLQIEVEEMHKVLVQDQELLLLDTNISNNDVFTNK